MKPLNTRDVSGYSRRKTCASQWLMGQRKMREFICPLSFCPLLSSGQVSPHRELILLHFQMVPSSFFRCLWSLVLGPMVCYLIPVLKWQEKLELQAGDWLACGTLTSRGPAFQGQVTRWFLGQRADAVSQMGLGGI